jgi:hypothetical protein
MPLSAGNKASQTLLWFGRMEQWPKPNPTHAGSMGIHLLGNTSCATLEVIPPGFYLVPPEWESQPPLGNWLAWKWTAIPIIFGNCPMDQWKLS